jgi:hypothetical protein
MLQVPAQAGSGSPTGHLGRQTLRHLSVSISLSPSGANGRGYELWYFDQAFGNGVLRHIDRWLHQIPLSSGEALVGSVISAGPFSATCTCINRALI